MLAKFYFFSWNTLRKDGLIHRKFIRGICFFSHHFILPYDIISCLWNIKQLSSWYYAYIYTILLWLILSSSLHTVVDKSIDLVIPAHDGEVGAIAVNPDGTLIASASERGHIIKIYSTDAGEVVQELKRGNSKADIDNILFHPHQYILACTSSKQSIHIFEITKAVEKCI